jgi:hypothetical protein
MIFFAGGAIGKLPWQIAAANCRGKLPGNGVMFHVYQQFYF